MRFGGRLFKHVVEEKRGFTVNVNGPGGTVAKTDRPTSRIETLFTVLPDPIEAFREWRMLVVTHEVKGAKVHDARLVAIMLVHEVPSILTPAQY